MSTVANLAARANSCPRHAEHTSQTDPTVLAVARVLDELAKAELSGAGYRVALDLVSRFLRRGITSEATPIIWVADRLQIHRNAVGNAYRDMVAAGLITRSPVECRGAPTRTTLTTNYQRLLAQCAADGLQSSRAPATSSSRPETAQRAGHGDGRSKSAPLSPTESVKSQQPDFVAPTSVPPAHADNFRFDPDVQRSLQAKLGNETMCKALECTSIQQVGLDASITLTAAELDHLKRTLRRPDPRPPAQRSGSMPKPHATEQRPAISPQIAAVAVKTLNALAKQYGHAHAAKLAAEIAYCVAHRNLGNGNVERGFAAGAKLIRLARWESPAGMPSEWRCLSLAPNGGDGKAP